jgi:hypothetical protein
LTSSLDISGRSSSSDLCLAALAACTAAVPPDHPIFDAASKAAPSDTADVTRLLTAIVRVRHVFLDCHPGQLGQLSAVMQVRHREAAHVVNKTKVSLLPLLPHANENQLGQLAQVCKQKFLLEVKQSMKYNLIQSAGRGSSWCYV